MQDLDRLEKVHDAGLNGFPSEGPGTMKLEV